jgi:general secretion pathway protein G
VVKAFEQNEERAMEITKNQSIRRLRRSRSRARHLARAGMTLVEIMIVVIIMAMIAAAVGVAVLPRLNEARIQQARTDAQSIRGAVEMFLAQNPSADCPSVGELVEERVLSANTRSRDPWDNDFSVECEGEDITVISAGPDGQMGTEDDVQ